MRLKLAKGLLALLLAAMAAAAQPAAGPAAPSDLARRLDEYARPLVAAGDLSGTLLVARDGVVIYETAFGMASYELGVPNSPATLYGVASINKPLTTIIAIRLLEQKKLALSDTVAKWLPDFPRGGEITVEHLLRHRSGIPHRVTSAAEEAVPHTAAEVTEFARRHPLLFAPGSKSSYSSGGFTVLVRILELAAGRPYEKLLEEIVLAPAGAVHTVHPSPGRLIEGRAQSYFRGPAGPLAAPLKDLSFLVGAGALFSTPRDLLAIQQALLAGRYGESARRSLLEEDGGLDWNGLTNGYRAFADHHAGPKLTVIFAGNLFTGAADLLRRDVPKIAAGLTLPPLQMPKVQPVAVPAALRGRYEGVYEIRAGDPDSREELRFTSTEGSLARLGDWLLIPTGDGTFYSPQDYGTIQAVLGKDEAIEGLDWTTPGGSFRLPRVAPPAKP